jgi:hypothetical protein
METDMRGFSSKFLNRLWFAHHVGALQKMDGKYLSLPLYHRRPPPPFKPRLTRMEKINLRNWMATFETI